MPTGIQTNRSAIELPSDISNEILETARGESVVMRLATRMPLPGRGLTIPVILGDPEAQWVDETNPKPVKNPNVGYKNMKGYTLSVILPFSNQFRRDLASLYDAILARLPGALAQKFDATVIGAVAAPGSHFDTLAAATAQSLLPGQNTTAYDGLVAANVDIATHGGVMNGIAVGPQGNGILMSAKDNQGRPLFLPSTNDGAITGILGARVLQGRGIYKAGAAASGGDAAVPAIVGVAGDWRQSAYGMVKDFEVSFSDQASITVLDADNQPQVINLWERNMFAVRAEFEVGFVANAAAFNLLTGATPT